MRLLSHAQVTPPALYGDKCATLYLTSRGSEDPEGDAAFEVEGGEAEAALDDEGETEGCNQDGPVECCQPQGADMSATQLGKEKPYTQGGDAYA